jgi:hypothetical protein
MLSFKQFCEVQVNDPRGSRDAFVVNKLPKAKDDVTPDQEPGKNKKKAKKAKDISSKKKPEEYLKSLMTPAIMTGPNA